MHLTTALVSMLLASSPLVSARTYNAAVDACAPSDKAFKGPASTDYLPCVVTSAARPWTRHDCGNRGYIVYDYVKNTFQIDSDSPQGKRLTFHAQCVETKNNIARQIDHADISTPPPGPITWARKYAGMHKGACNIENPGTSVQFFSWTLSDAEYQTCIQGPVWGH